MFPFNMRPIASIIRLHLNRSRRIERKRFGMEQSPLSSCVYVLKQAKNNSRCCCQLTLWNVAFNRRYNPLDRSLDCIIWMFSEWKGKIWKNVRYLAAFLQFIDNFIFFLNSDSFSWFKNLESFNSISNAVMAYYQPLHLLMK